ncbi:hypothetical protein [Falsarthrobacter nasiphocae]|uniref:Uncharacterized protein n=1 Tax=Falsarthrobacter nasiphocae TaxID=189863 RepID=A0AAE4C4H8_9MICC|nr:hypothetical protein [Falsarthrobacter nasiphocae]MDR6891366.1 hypothetical protein [Falsarthrobacter nasiphocae]
MDPDQFATPERKAYPGCTYCGRTFAEPGEIAGLRARGDVTALDDARGRQRTNDHVPSKVLLDDPLPTTLHTVPCCQRCNNGFSAAERYLACLLECVLAGDTDANKFTRPKMARIFNEQGSSNIRKIISDSRMETPDGTFWKSDTQQSHMVLKKMARGHAAVNGFPLLSDPFNFWVLPLEFLTHEQRNEFEYGISDNRLFPETGSFALDQIGRAAGRREDWVTVQPGRYRYSYTVQKACIRVRIVLREYLACEAAWDHP